MNSQNTHNPILSVEAAIRKHAARLKQSSSAMLDARLIVGSVLQLDPSEVILAGPQQIRDRDQSEIASQIERRLKGEPVAYIIGMQEFYSLSFKTKPGILIPRPETELIVDEAVRLRDRKAPVRILDLGVGSGCVLLSLLRQFPNATGVGIDINQHAASLARENAQSLGVFDRANILVGNWLEPLKGRFDIVVSNPPYIKDQDLENLPIDVSVFEDPRALFGGKDGFDAYAQILSCVGNHLNEGALLIFEVGCGQHEKVSNMARQAFGNARITVEQDLAEIPRIVSVDLRDDKPKPFESC